MAKLIINREKLPILLHYISMMKIEADFDLSGSYKEVGGKVEMTIDNNVLSINDAIEVDIRGADIYKYPIYYEIAKTDIDNNIPDEVSWGTYYDDQEPPVLQNRKWSDLDISKENDTHKIVYWQSSNDGKFSHEDANILSDSGVESMPRGVYDVEVNKRYTEPDEGETEVVPIETILNISLYWKSSVYYDWLNAQLIMSELYEA